MDLLGRWSLFTFIILLTQQHLVSTQSCQFDGENSYLNVEVTEFSELVSIGDFRSDTVVAVEEVLPSNEYIEFIFEPAGVAGGKLDIKLKKSLTQYFRDPEVDSDTFSLDNHFRVDCADGSNTIHTLIVRVIDENEPPEFDDPSKDTFDIQYPWDLNVPVNYDTDVFTVDWDFNEDFSNQISYTTSEPEKIVVEYTSQWDSTTPRPRRNSLKLKLLDQLTESLTFNVTATDAGLPPVEKSFTINVTAPINVSPPKFEEYFYKAEIPDFPNVGDRIIGEDGNPLKISVQDAESNPFTVTSSSRLISIQEDVRIPGDYYIYFAKEVDEDDISGFVRGVGLIEIIARESAPADKESSVVLLLYFNKVLTTEPTASTTFYTTISTQETEHTCPPCTTVPVESTPTSITCPDITTITVPTPCPDTTTTAYATTCPDVTCEPCSTTEESSTVTNGCPETTTIYVSTPCPDSTSTENTPDSTSSTGSTNCPETTTIYVSTPCPDSTSTENTPDSTSSTGSTNCPETTTVYVSTPCPDSTSTENTPDTSETSTPMSTSPVTECPDVCTTETAETTSLTTCPESTTIYVSTPCTDSTSSTENTPLTSETSACPVTDCPVTDCPTTTSGTESTPTVTRIPCDPVPCLTTTPADCSCSSPVSCPTIDDCEDDSVTGFIVGLVVLSVLLFAAAGVAVYLWLKLRKRRSNPFEKFTAEPWIPDTVDEKANSYTVESPPSDVSPYSAITPYMDPPAPTTAFSVEPDPPITSEPVNFGSRGRASQPELSQATNLLVETPPPAPTPALVTPEPEVVPPPAIPRPDYSVGVVFDERVEVFTPAVQEYSDDEGPEGGDGGPAVNEGEESERL